MTPLRGNWHHEMAPVPDNTKRVARRDPRKIPQGHALYEMGLGGLEPPTSRLSGVRSNHLSYRPFRT